MPATKIVCIVHYNTPKLTECAIRSLDKHTQGCYVVVFDNSDRKPFAYDGIGQLHPSTIVRTIDNTQGQIINFDEWLNYFPNREWSRNNYGSAKHCISVQYLIDFIHAGYSLPFVLMDSDVLIRKDIAPLFDDSVAWVGHIGCNTRKRFGFEVLKVDPFLCFINTPMIQQHGIRYFNPQRMWNLVSTPPYNRYDTGAWFYEDCMNHRLPYREIDTKEYILHLRHGSWRDKDASAWLEENKELWQ